MAVPTVLTDLSTTIASNYPAGSDSPNTIDDHIRALAGILRREQAKGANLASASTVNIGAITDGNFVHITGTTTITAFDTVAAGVTRWVVFDGALTLTHNATSLILPSGANITTAANDVACFESEGSGNWRCMFYVKADGTPLALGAGTVATAKIADDAVTYAKIQNVSATSRILGRKTSGAGDTEECTLSEVLDFIGSAAQGDILYRGASGWARLGASTDGYYLKTQGAGANPTWAAVSSGPFSSVFASSNQTITAGSLLTLPHSLSATPNLIQIRYVCISSDGGWSVNDEVYLDHTDSNDTYAGWVAYADATNVYVRFNNSLPNISLMRKDTGAGFRPDIATPKWKIKVYAWA